MEKALMGQKALAEYLDMSLPEFYRVKGRFADFPKPLTLSNSDSLQAKKYYLRSEVDHWLEGLRKDKAQ